MTATSGPGSSHVRSSSDFEPQKCQFGGPFLSDFKTCQKSENQAETAARAEIAARALVCTFGKVQNQGQNQIRNRELSKMALFEARKLHEALRVTPRCQRGSEKEKGHRVEAFGSF